MSYTYIYIYICIIHFLADAERAEDQAGHEPRAVLPVESGRCYFKLSFFAMCLIICMLTHIS